MYSFQNKYVLQTYYVYALINPLTNKPFYVGKGQEQRYLDHFRDVIAERGNNQHKNNTIKKIMKANKDIIIEIVFTSDDENMCFEKEKELIKFYGRKDKKTGFLTNLTDGGEGTVGVDRHGPKNSMFGKKHTDKARISMSETRQQKFQSGEIIPKKHTEEHKQKLRENNPGGRATAKRIYQIDAMTGQVIKEWSSTRQAGKALDIVSWRNISHSANKFKNRVVGGYYWRWIGDPSVIDNKLVDINELNQIRLDPGLRSGKAVQQILPKTGEVIKTWKNMCEVARELNISCSTISAGIKRNNGKAVGFIWKLV